MALPPNARLCFPRTQFTSSLKKIYFVPAPPGNPFGPPTPTVCFFTEPPLQLIAEKLPAARRTAAIARAKERLASITAEVRSLSDFNEATARFQIIDRILTEVFGWDRAGVEVEFVN